MRNFIIAGTLLIAALTSCGTDTPEKETKEVKEYEFKETNCKYRLDIENTQVNWVGYKLEKKTGVNGSFTSKFVDNPPVTDAPEKLLEGLTATVDVTSVSTQDEARDAKIVKSFFQTMKDSSFLRAEFKNMKITSKDANMVLGTIDMELKMNGMVQTLPAKFQVANKKIKVSTTLDIPSFGAQASLDALNKVCEEKHKGEGNKAVTWPDVSINLSAPYLEKCK